MPKPSLAHRSFNVAIKTMQQLLNNFLFSTNFVFSYLFADVEKTTIVPHSNVYPQLESDFIPFGVYAFSADKLYRPLIS